MGYVVTDDNIKRKDNRLSAKVTPLHIILFVISIFIGLFVNFMGVLPNSVMVVGCYASIITGYGGLAVYMSDSKAYKNKGFIIWMLLIVYMLIAGFVVNAFGVGSYSGSNLLTQDIRYCMYAAIGFALSDERYVNIYKRLMQFIGFVAIFFGIYGLLTYEFNISGVLEGERIGIWGISYYCWWMVGSAAVFLFSYALAGGNKKSVAYICFGLYLTLGLLFIKRQPVVEALILFVLIKLMYKQRNKMLKTVGLIIVAVIVLAWLSTKVPYIRALVDSLTDRFEQDYSTSSRVDEVGYFKNISNFFTYLFGYGLGNEFIFEGVHKNAIHIGFYDVLYKGGIMFLLFYAYLFKSALCMAFRQMRGQINLNPMEIASVAVTLLAVISLTFGMCFTYTTVIINFATPFGIVISHPASTFTIKKKSRV